MIRFMPCIVIVSCMFSAIGPALTAVAAVPEPVTTRTATRPTTVVAPDSCVTSQCHSGVKQHQVIHGPVNVNACDSCHTPGDVKKHTFTMARQTNQLCTFCHKVDVQDAKVVHEPVANGQCLSCHNPHGGFDRNFLRAQSMADLCKSCHASITRQKNFVHGPVAAGACGACHLPHQSQLPKLLRTQGRDLCLGCHREMDKLIKTVPFPHEAVKEGCTQCHDPHASDYQMMIKQPPAQLCTQACHQDIKKAISKAKYQHSAVVKDTACINCHTPHGGDLATLMKDKPVNICLKCHNKPIRIKDGRLVTSVADIIDPKLTKHGPVDQGRCGGCHNVHGSDHPRLLVKEYPATFYETFKLEYYDLCFSCHDKQLVMLKNTTGLTGFRNGDKNLHYLHVHKDKRGRTCRACHSVHASNFQLLIRQSVPYGSWKLPINYKQTPTGGSCAPGCHQPFSYDRQNPVANTPGKP